jgi:hypothetical protein
MNLSRPEPGSVDGYFPSLVDREISFCYSALSSPFMGRLVLENTLVFLFSIESTLCPLSNQV